MNFSVLARIADDCCDADWNDRTGESDFKCDSDELAITMRPGPEVERESNVNKILYLIAPTGRQFQEDSRYA